MKLIDDTLKNPDGKYSRKSITLFVSFSAALFYEFALPFFVEWFNLRGFIHQSYVFQSLLAFTELLFFATVYDKTKRKEINEKFNN